MSDYEVYIAKHGDIVLYVGEGKVGRHQHIKSGLSHVYEANRLHFMGIDVAVGVVETFNSKQEVVALEKELIAELSPLWNKIDKSCDSIRARAEYRKHIVRAQNKNIITNPTQVKFLDYCVSKMWRSGVCHMSVQEVVAHLGTNESNKILYYISKDSKGSTLKKLSKLVSTKKIATSDYIVSLTDYFKGGIF